MKTVAFHTLGCKVNQYETEAITEQFLAANYKVVSFEDQADVYVINTCTVTNIADKKSRKMLSKAKKLNGNSIVVAVGCYVQVAYEQLEQVPFVDVLVGNTHKNDLVSIVEDYAHTKEKEFLIENVHKDVVYEELTIHSQQNKTRSTIKIQDGCNQYCTYCIIPFTRGKVRSRQPALVLEEVTELAARGFKEIILTGIHLASYGMDLEHVSLINLIEDLNRIRGIERIRLGSLEPNFIDEALLGRLKGVEAFCDHFHLSMQSGSDTVLERMNRRYNTAEYYEKVSLIRQYYHNPAITTDIIVGFPGESEEEARETYEFVAQVGFSDAHVFKYSIRQGTKAAAMKGQVDGRIKSQRSKKLTSLVEQLKVNYNEGFKNTLQQVLFEEIIRKDDEEFLLGHMKNYVKVYLRIEGDMKKGAKAKDFLNKMVEVYLMSIYEEGLLGKVSIPKH